MGNGVTVNNTASVSQQDIIDSLTEQLAKANERVDSLEKALANCADALYESNINHKKAIAKIQAECIDVLFDFAAKRDDSGFAVAMHKQPHEIQDAIRTFKQLRKGDES
jgi:septal ring factor EnvC (AmiA/AmiB activator)